MTFKLFVTFYITTWDYLQSNDNTTVSCCPLLGHLLRTYVSQVECYLDNYSRHERHECRQAYLGRSTAIPRYHLRSFPQHRGTIHGLRGNYQLYNQRGNQVEAAGNLLRKDITSFHLPGGANVRIFCVIALRIFIECLSGNYSCRSNAYKYQFICIELIFLVSSFFLEFNPQR